MRYLRINLFLIFLMSCNTQPNPEKGDSGDPGAQGEQGETGSSGEGERGSTGPRGPRGANGEGSCAVIEVEDGAVIKCTDGTTVTIVNGTSGIDGIDGVDGVSGGSCSVVDHPEGATIICSDGSEVIVRDGEQGGGPIVDHSFNCSGYINLGWDRYGVRWTVSHLSDGDTYIAGRHQFLPNNNQWYPWESVSGFGPSQDTSRVRIRAEPISIRHIGSGVYGDFSCLRGD